MKRMSVTVLLFFLSLPVVFVSICASAQTYTESILYNFSSASGGASGPTSGLVMDKSNNLFGASNGVVFKLSSKGTYTILSQKGGSSTLVMDKAGTLYGTSSSGGLGYGFVYKLTSSKKLSVLHQFGRMSGDGLNPAGPVTLDTAGNLYGTTQFGGDATCNCGTVYKVSTKGVETILYKFLGGTDGSFPQANVLRDGKGNMYGTTSGGSDNGNGVVWKLDSKNVESTFYTPPASDLSYSQLNYLVRDSAGNSYTELNGNDNYGNQNGGMVQTNGTTSTFFLWYYFFNSCPLPLPIGALMVSGGTLYGTEEIGGAYAVCDENNGIYLNGGGDVYSFAPTTGTQTFLYSFPDPSSGLTDGFYPYNGVIADTAGNLYGTTAGGGLYGSGTVFKLTKN